MRFQEFAINENMIDKAMSALKRFDIKKVKNTLKDEFANFVDMIQSAGVEKEVVQIINKNFDTRYKGMKDMERLKLRESDETLNEDLSHWWDVVKSEAFPTLAFYPALTAWLEIDKLLSGQGFDGKKTTIYALFWLLLVSGKYVKGWKKWKEQNPEEHAQERAKGKGGII